MFSDTEAQKITAGWRVLWYQDICAYEHMEIFGFNTGKHSQGVIAQIREGED